MRTAAPSAAEIFRYIGKYNLSAREYLVAAVRFNNIDKGNYVSVVA